MSTYAPVQITVTAQQLAALCGDNVVEKQWFDPSDELRAEYHAIPEISSVAFGPSFRVQNRAENLNWCRETARYPEPVVDDGRYFLRVNAQVRRGAGADDIAMFQEFLLDLLATKLGTTPEDPEIEAEREIDW